MNRNTIDLLFALLRSVIHGTPMSEEERLLFSEENVIDLIAISKKHDIAHLIVLGLENNALLKNNDETGKELYKAIYRYERINYEFKKLCDILETSKIPFAPLKGAVIRQYYPEPWMRTSCDIDILIKEDDVEIAAQILTDSYGYIRDRKGTHDISLFSENGIHIELHYNLVENNIANQSAIILEKVWDIVVRKNGYCYWYEMPDDFFYLYHIAHMVKHFELGGCGIRTFVDLWILDNLDTGECSKRNVLLNQCGLLKFADAARTLSKVWLDRSEHTMVSLQMEHFILTGGVYGTVQNHVTIQQHKKGGKIRYILSRIFFPYEKIKRQYPILEKWRILTPIMEVHRWFRLLFSKKVRQRTRKEVENIQSSQIEAVNIQMFLEEIGLK